MGLGLHTRERSMTYTLTKDGRDLEATEEQSTIIDFAKGEKPPLRLLLNALAGAAKTSTLELLCKYLPVEPTLSVAFNKKIADEMTKRLPGHVRCATMNSVGHRVWGAAVGKKLTLDTKKNYNLVKDGIDRLGRREKEMAWDCFSDMTKAIASAKLSGYIPKGLPAAPLISEDEFFGHLDEEPEGFFIQIVNEALRTGIKQAYAGLIDFDDQIYMPTLFGGSFPSFPRVMVDEAQDLSALNHEMIRRLVTRDLIAVGDPNQSIYAFRGAVTSSMSRLKSAFSMHEMTLSISFRCPISGIKRQQDRVPHMKWAPWAIEGQIETLPSWAAKEIPDASAIICRNNAPLFSCALQLIRAGRGCHLVGTDLGPQLIKTLKKFGDASMTQEKVYEAIDGWERDKLRKSRNAASVSDKAECLRVFAEFGPTLGAAIAYAEHLFAAKGPIQLLSGHKAKGLEWDTIYHLDPHRIPSPWCKEGEALEQEFNVRYVIETRFKKEMFLVRLEDFNNGQD